MTPERDFNLQKESHVKPFSLLIDQPIQLKPRSSREMMEEDEFFTADVVNALCTADLPQMRTNLLEEILNQKKQELLRNPEVSSWLAEQQRDVLQQRKNNHELSTSSNNDGDGGANNSSLVTLSGDTDNRTHSAGDNNAPAKESGNNTSQRHQHQQTQQPSHIAVHPSVYTLNRQKGSGVKTQAKSTSQQSVNR